MITVEPIRLDVDSTKEEFELGSIPPETSGVDAESAIQPTELDVDCAVEEFELGSSPDESVGLDMNMAIRVTRLEEGSLPLGGHAGDILIKRSDEPFDSEWIPPATSVEQDNTRPITAGAVYTEIGNINALLATI